MPAIDGARDDFSRHDGANGPADRQAIQKAEAGVQISVMPGRRNHTSDRCAMPAIRAGIIERVERDRARSEPRTKGKGV
jgi:hypothetical protein